MIEAEDLGLPRHLAERVKRWVADLNARDPGQELTEAEQSASDSDGLNVAIALSTYRGESTLVQFSIGDWALGFRSTAASRSYA